MNKIIDLKNNIPNGNTITNSNNRISTESNFEKMNRKKNQILFFPEDIFQTVEDSDFLATKQLIKTNENIVNS